MSVPVRTGVAAAARCLALDALAAEALDAFRRADLPTVLLKGAGLAHRLYPDAPDRRRYSDVDLLVAPATFDRAQQVLAQLGLTDRAVGLREDEMHWWERSWRQPGPTGLTVDLHRGFAGVGDPAAFWRLLTAGAETLDLGGVPVHVPDAAGCALVVGLHAAVPGPGRKPLTDLGQALTLLPEAVWDRAGRLARATRSTDAFARGLSRHPDGQAVLVRLGLRGRGSTLAEHLVAQQADGAAVSLARVLDVRGPRDRLGLVVRRLVPSPALMRLGHPVARRGTVGLAAAYVIRAGRLAAAAPGGALLVRDARRDLGPAPPGPRRRTVRALAGLDGRDRRTCLWTVWALHRTRRQLAAAPLADLDLTGPPAAGRGGELTVRRVLVRRGANCIETSLVLQRWWAAQGVARDLALGVSAPGPGFHAHAWLHDPDRPDGHAGLAEIHRRPPPSGWLAGAGSR